MLVLSDARLAVPCHDTLQLTSRVKPCIEDDCAGDEENEKNEIFHMIDF
jgi:hypothetical protein